MMINDHLPSEIETAPVFHLMAKPAGPHCNLRCDYCFYLEKKAFFPKNHISLMSDEILEAYTRKYIASQPGSSVIFAWQGGEPTLPGIEFFQRALAFQKKHGYGKQIANTLQTNGTLIDEKWASFLAENNFLVGLSLDGPGKIHDAYRKDARGKSSFKKVIKAFEIMQKNGVEVNVLAAVSRKSSQHPLEIYHFFKQLGVKFIQFIPIVERTVDSQTARTGMSLAAPPSLTRGEKSKTLPPWTVESAKYGDFLIRVFQEWIRSDVGRIFVMNFEWCLGAWAGMPAGVCYHSPRCGRSLILEHNGDIFSCDHFMYPAYRVGNILSDHLNDIILSEKQNEFGSLKETTLPGYCRQCHYLFVCRGGCPKHRFTKSPHGEPGFHYLCPGLIRFYRYVEPAMVYMTNLVEHGIPVDQVMKVADILLVSE